MGRAFHDWYLIVEGVVDQGRRQRWPVRRWSGKRHGRRRAVAEAGGCTGRSGLDARTGTGPELESRTTAGRALGVNGLAQVHSLTTRDSSALIYEGGSFLI